MLSKKVGNLTPEELKRLQKLDKELPKLEAEAQKAKDLSKAKQDEITDYRRTKMEKHQQLDAVIDRMESRLLKAGGVSQLSAGGVGGDSVKDN